MKDIRQEDGAIVAGDPLRISMVDFASPDNIPATLRNKTVDIPVEKMHKIIVIAERTQGQ